MRFINALILCVSFQVLVDAATYPIDDTVGLGRVFNGIGGLSGGGATSKLLVNYPEQQRNEILDYLFKPKFGASLHILKVEIGGDSQSTDGTEASHMHDPWDENYARGYEWWLMLEAKKRNPDILLYGLPWAFPGWVGNGTGSPYKYPNVTATYITKWVLGAKKVYNLTIDYLGIWNERDYNVDYIKILRSVLDANGLSNVQLVAPDGAWNIATDILDDTDLAKAVAAVGAHYPGTTTTSDAVKTGKPLWASEDYSTYNDAVGGGCWARIVNQNYVNGYMTSTISWNLIASYYDVLPFARDGLMTANEPWSGHYEVSSPIWVTAHTTQFAQPGWIYLNHTTGGVGRLEKGGSYVSLVSPDKKDLTIVFETMAHNMSVCIRPGLPPYNVSVQDVTFNFGGSWKSLSELHAWVSVITLDDNDSDLFKYMGTLSITGGELTLPDVPPNAVVTLTTVANGQKGAYGTPPPSKPFPLPYFEDFNAFPLYSEPFNFAPQAGSFEILQSSDERKHHRVLTQTVLEPPIRWCDQVVTSPIGVIGNSSWTDIQVSVDVKVEDISSAEGVFVAVKVDRGGCNTPSALGKFFWLIPSEGRFVVTNDLAMNQVATSGELPASVIIGTWHRVTLATSGPNLQGLIDGQPIFSSNISAQAPFQGFVAFGTKGFGYASFDDLEISS